MRIAVVGVGGVGGYFGARLAVAGNEVHVIARGAHLEAIREHGLRVSAEDGDFVANPASATSDPGDVGPVDLVVFAVKSWQLEEAASVSRSMVTADTAVLPLLNGVEATDILAREFGAERVLAGLCRVHAQIAGPGQIAQGGFEPIVVFGELDDARSDRGVRLRDAFAEARVKAEVPENIAVAVWEKFMLISTWSGIGAITRAPIGVWREIPEMRSMAEGCLREIEAVARARGVDLPEDATERVLSFLDGAPPDATASMQRDIFDRRPSELEAQNGAVVRMGSALGIATPHHALIHAALLPQERAARS